MDQRRTFIAIALCFGILVFWQTVVPKVFPDWFPKPAVHESLDEGFDGGAKASAAGARDAGAVVAGGAAGADAGVLPDGGAVAIPPQAGSAAGTGADSAPAAAVVKLGPPARAEQTVVLHNDKVKATFSTHGAAIKSWLLTDPQFEQPAKQDQEGKPGVPHPVDLVQIDAKEALPFSTTFGGLDWPASADYELVSSSETEAVFRASAGGVSLEKRFSLAKDKPYALSMEFALTGGPADGITPRVLLARTPPEVKHEGGILAMLSRTMPDVVRPSCAYGKEIERRTYDEDEKSFAHSGEVEWVSIDSRYFLTAMYPAKATPGVGCAIEIPEKRRLRASMELPKLKPGETLEVESYLGPKFKTQLANYGHGLERSIDFGFFGLLSLFLLYLMTFFEGLVGNWGLAIILLTVTVKSVLLPLTNWSMRSMERMRMVQPKMKALKDKYGKDQPRFQQETMKLYKEEGVSPFGGCLPMMLQFPIWIALYRTILNTAELYHTGFISGWLEDLSAPEMGAVKILPILMGITMFAMQKMQPTAATGDDSQAKMQKTMMYMMPPFFTLIMYSLPTGLTLYIFVNNLLSIAQQYYIRKKQEKLAAAAS